jgi:spermidine/putrescine transport system permease protein
VKTLSKIYNGIVFAFLYAPILVLIFFSFNEGKSRVRWEGFTFKWYAELFQNELIIESLMLTLKIAVLAAVVSTIIGTLAAVGIYSMNGRLRTLMMGVNNIPMVNPEIVTGISMMLMFVAIYRATGLLQPGFLTLLLAHVTFCIPYVVLQVMPKLRQMNKHMYEAALDLGCRPIPAFFKVVLPEIMPGVITGALMAFTMSLDDFVISYFNSGASAQNLSVTIYSMTKKPVTPEINALSTLMFGAVLFLLVVVNIRQVRDLNKQKERR